MTHHIRPYQPPNDTSPIIKIWDAANALAHPFLTKTFVDQVRHDIEHLYLPNAETWVIADQADPQKLLGFISLIVTAGQTTEVGGIFIDPQLQGQGLGHALMDHAQEIHSDLEVEVFKENKIAPPFYLKYGFEIIEEKTFPPTGDRVLRLKFTLASTD